MSSENVPPPSRKKAKRQQRQAKKREKQEARLARKEAKRARKAEQVRVRYRSNVDREQAVAVLEQILAGLKSGTVTVEHGEEQLTVRPADLVNLSIDARQTHKSESLRLRVRWPRTAGDGQPPLKISPE